MPKKLLEMEKWLLMIEIQQNYVNIFALARVSFLTITVWLNTVTNHVDNKFTPFI